MTDRPDPTPVALYARVSSERQDVDLSVAAQLRALREHAEKHGYLVVREYVDEAESRRVADRPEFRKMLDEASGPDAPFREILVWKFSRFTRKREHAVAFKSMLRRRGIRVVSITEHADDSPTGKLMEAIIESVDEFYSENLLRNVNAIVTGEARFPHLHDESMSAVQEGLGRAEKCANYALNLIAGRLGLDHDRVLFGRNALPVMSRYIDRRGGHLADAAERDRLLYWYFQSAMWGRFSGSTETVLDQDLAAIEDIDIGIEQLIEQLRLWHGSLRVEPAHFRGWSLGARFYPVLYALTRVGEAQDWGTGLVLRHALLGRMNALEVHHIFPKALLYRTGFQRPQVNAVANFCFLTKDTNLQISDRPPAEYFREVEARHPGALASQWIPMDEELWETANYARFLEERQRLLAAAANALLDELLHHAHAATEVAAPAAPEEPAAVPGGIEDPEEDAVLRSINDWVRRQGLPEGHIEHELAHPETGDPLAILDCAWPDGLQKGYSEPVALLLGEEQETLQIANDHGFRHFTDTESFKRYAETEVLALAGETTP